MRSLAKFFILSKQKKKKASKKPFSFHTFAYQFLGSSPAKYFPLSENIREKILKSNIRINHMIYVSSMFFWSAAALAITLIMSLFFSIFIMPASGLNIPVNLAVIYSLLSGVAAGAISCGIFMYYPNYIASTVKRGLERDLVYSVNYMSILMGAGATVEETFASLTRVGKVFGINNSAKAIMKDIEFLGADTITAVDTESERTPSRDYADFLQGYIATTQTGGDVQEYFQSMADKFMELRKRQIDKMIEQLNVAGEMFVAILIAFPIIMITMFSIMGLFGGDVFGGLSAVQLMTLMTYLLIPMLAVGMLIFIDGVMANW
jgi:archaellum biogenesis protein FlaJ (TadC family)